MELLLDQATKRTRRLPSTPSLPMLAQPAADLTGVEQPYDLAIIVPELALAGADNQDGEDRWLQQFSDAARFEVHPQKGGPHFEADVLWGAEKLGRLSYKFEPRSGGEVRLNIEKLNWRDDGDHHAELLRICRNPETLTIYFDTGHSFSRGHFYKTQFRDQRFEGWQWVNMSKDGIIVQQEKPVDGRRLQSRISASRLTGRFLDW